MESMQQLANRGAGVLFIYLEAVLLAEDLAAKWTTRPVSTEIFFLYIFQLLPTLSNTNMIYIGGNPKKSIPRPPQRYINESHDTLRYQCHENLQIVSAPLYSLSDSRHSSIGSRTACFGPQGCASCPVPSGGCSAQMPKRRPPHNTGTCSLLPVCQARQGLPALYCNWQIIKIFNAYSFKHFQSSIRTNFIVNPLLHSVIYKGHLT